MKDSTEGSWLRQHAQDELVPEGGLGSTNSRVPPARSPHSFPGSALALHPLKLPVPGGHRAFVAALEAPLACPADRGPPGPRSRQWASAATDWITERSSSRREPWGTVHTDTRIAPAWSKNSPAVVPKEVASRHDRSMAGSRVPHVCVRPVDPTDVNRIGNLHESQAGVHRGHEHGRHTCPRCAFAEGKRAGAAAQKRDKRRRKWRLLGPVEICEFGRAAPSRVLTAIRAQGRAEGGGVRWACASCAWALGWSDGVAHARGQPPRR